MKKQFKINVHVRVIHFQDVNLTYEQTKGLRLALYNFCFEMSYLKVAAGNV